MNIQPATFVERRVQGIDLLRGLCIVAVVLHHINLRIRFHESAFGKLIGPAADRVLFWSGYYGVRVFFVISGFLIAGWSLKRWNTLSNINLKQFYLMRFARIVPCLVALLALLAALHLAAVPQFTINPQRSTLGRALLAAGGFHINWLEGHRGYLPAAWDVLWSLSVEEVFYIFFPLVCALARKPALIAGLLGCFVVAGPFARTLITTDPWSDYSYLSCVDGIALGCLAAMVMRQIRLHSGKTMNVVLGLSGTLLCLLIVVFRGTAARIGFYKVGLDVAVLNLGTALLLIALQLRFEKSAGAGDVSESGWKKALQRSTSFLRWFGRNSYEVYLTHMLIVWPMVMLYLHFKQTASSMPLWFLAISALTGVTGFALARWYSEPLNRIIRIRFSDKPRSVAMVAAVHDG